MGTEKGQLVSQPRQGVCARPQVTNTAGNSTRCIFTVSPVLTGQAGSETWLVTPTQKGWHALTFSDSAHILLARADGVVPPSDRWEI